MVTYSPFSSLLVHNLSGLTEQESHRPRRMLTLNASRTLISSSMSTNIMNTKVSITTTTLGTTPPV